MGGFAQGKSRAPITGINVTPLVDITLVLLIIFMVTAKLVVSRAMPMDLPKAATGHEVQRVFAVGLARDGVITVDGTPVAGDRDLLARAQAALAEAPEVRAVVDADDALAHGTVMHAMDVLRQAGLTRVAFGVKAGPRVAL